MVHEQNAVVTFIANRTLTLNNDNIHSLVSSRHGHLLEPCRYGQAQIRRLDFSAPMSRTNWYLSDHIFKRSTPQKLLVFPHHGTVLLQLPVQCGSIINLQIIRYALKHYCTYDRAEMSPAVHQPPWSDTIYTFRNLTIRAARG
jgi:hypothetical protein